MRLESLSKSHTLHPEDGCTRSSETSVSYNINTRRRNPEDHDLNLYPSPTHLTLKMEAKMSSETLVSYYITTQCHNPDDNDLNLVRVFLRFLSFSMETLEFLLLHGQFPLLSNPCLIIHDNISITSCAISRLCLETALGNLNFSESILCTKPRGAF